MQRLCHSFQIPENNFPLKTTLLYRLLLVAFLDALAKFGINPIGLIHRGRRSFRLGIFGRNSRNKRDASIGEPQRSVRASPRLPIIFAARYPTPFGSKLFQIDHAHERILTVDRRSPAARETLRVHMSRLFSHAMRACPIVTRSRIGSLITMGKSG